MTERRSFTVALVALALALVLTVYWWTVWSVLALVVAVVALLLIRVSGIHKWGATILGTVWVLAMVMALLFTPIFTSGSNESHGGQSIGASP